MRSRYGPPWVRGERPPWWPANETWPPSGRSHRPAGFFMRMGCALLFSFLLINVAFAFLAFQALRAVGLVDVPSGAAAISAATALMIVLAFVTMGGVATTARRALRGLGDVMGAADRVADGEQGVRVTVRGPREVRRLITAFNSMVERLEQGEAQRRRLLADVTHELRTPLSVIQGQLEGAIDGVYARDDAQLGAILDETRHMSRIVEDLRIHSLAESGALRLVRQPLDVSEIVDDALDAYRAPAEATGVTIATDLPEDLPAVDADPTRVREVLANLVSNALRYTPAGGRVTVSARRDADAVSIAVADTGRGVSADELPRLFERFHRSPDSPGTGLGLAIARDLVRAHGGDITASSDGEGKGTTLRFTLPTAS